MSKIINKKLCLWTEWKEKLGEKSRINKKGVQWARFSQKSSPQRSTAGCSTSAKVLELGSLPLLLTQSLPQVALER